jgi:hypothetical protein
VIKVILNWQRSLWEGDWEILKRSARDKLLMFVIYMHMEAMLGISLYNYLYAKLVKMLCLFYYLLCFLGNKIREEGRKSSAWK